MKKTGLLISLAASLAFLVFNRNQTPADMHRHSSAMQIAGFSPAPRHVASVPGDTYANGTILRQLKKILCRLPSLDAECREMSAIEVSISADSPCLISPYSDAVYGHGHIVINQTRLEALYGELLKQGAPRKKALRYLAAHFAPVLAHELRHAINDRLYPGLKPTKEGEISGFLAEVAAFDEVHRFYPDAFRYRSELVGHIKTQLWNRWQEEGAAGLSEFVEHSPFYLHLPSLAELTRGSTRRKARAALAFHRNEWRQAQDAWCQEFVEACSFLSRQPSVSAEPMLAYGSDF
ncbi:MAG: hypothetical protein HYT79_01035 [Elusimicrobia bacterium]|nr:hypothetical protein [Elusimicrobiota bacterium]